MKLRMVLKLLFQLFQDHQNKDSNKSVRIIDPVSVTKTHFFAAVQEFSNRSVGEKSRAVTFYAKYFSNLTKRDWYRFSEKY